MPLCHRECQLLPRWRTVVLLLALLPACCAAPKPVPPPPEPALELPLPPPAPPVRPVLRAEWTFQTGPDSCIALARAGSASLQIAVQREGLIRLTVSLSGETPIRPVAQFSGPAGHWLSSGTHAGRRAVVFTLNRTNTSLSQILMLLSGGALNVGPSDGDVPILSLPESGADGQQWFACVRRIVTWA
jgi:hypothetical protein